MILAQPPLPQLATIEAPLVELRPKSAPLGVLPALISWAVGCWAAISSRARRFRKTRGATEWVLIENHIPNLLLLALPYTTSASVQSSPAQSAMIDSCPIANMLALARPIPMYPNLRLPSAPARSP